jgi:hypothetical protein
MTAPARHPGGRPSNAQLQDRLERNRLRSVVLTDELTAHNLEALAFVDRAAPLARQLELALEAIVAANEDAGPMWRHLHNIAGGLLYELGRYERRHLPAGPDPVVALQAAA